MKNAHHPGAQGRTRKYRIGGGLAVLLGLWAVGCTSPTSSTTTTTVSSVDAQYFAFYSTTKAYVSAYDYSGSTGGIYSFTPASASTSTATTYTTATLFMTDTTNGHVYSFNTSSHQSSTSSLVTTAEAAAEIKFYKGIG